MASSSITLNKPGSSQGKSCQQGLSEFCLPPMFHAILEYREAPPKLNATDLPEPERFHERLAAWLMKQH